MSEQLNAADSAALSSILHFISNLSAEDKKTLSFLFEDAQKKLTPAKKLFKLPVVNFSIHRDINDQLADMQLKVTADNSWNNNAYAVQNEKNIEKKEPEKTKESKKNDKREEIEFYYSPQLQMKTGATNLYSTYRLLFNVKEKITGNAFLEKNSLERVLKLIGLDLNLATYFTTYQHEYYGHVSAVRGLGGDSHFNPGDVELFFIFAGRGMKEGTFYNTKPIHAPSESRSEPEYWKKELKTTVGGYEADKIMADHIAEKIFIKGKTDNVTNLAYLSSKWNRSLYSIFLGNVPGTQAFNDNFNDPNQYVKELYNKYWLDPKYYVNGKYIGPAQQDIKNSSDTAALWSFFSPLALRVFKNEMNYIKTGQREFDMPKNFIDTDFNLGPDGPEYYLNYYTNTVNGSPQKLYARHNPIGEKSYGLGMKTFSKDKKGDINGAFGIDLWQQEGKFGGNVELEYKRKITQDFFLNLNAGYKTEGYIVGYPQQPGLYFGIGTTLRF